MKVIVNGKRWEDMTQAEKDHHKARWAVRANEMIANSRPPQARTEDTFRANFDATNGKQFEKFPKLGDTYRRVAEARGQSTTGKVYLQQLAAFPGDPRAWVDSRGEVRRVCEERGHGCEGAVTVKHREVPPNTVALADDLVREEVADRLVADPGLKPSKVEEDVRNERTPHWAK
ncbi:MAG TPA: hypothetical protein VFG68_16435 [Fimbriiglobus sp.]|nr:hypothetical protein [Fimbriiglobus sp.]